MAASHNGRSFESGGPSVGKWTSVEGSSRRQSQPQNKRRQHRREAAAAAALSEDPEADAAAKLTSRITQLNRCVSKDVPDRKQTKKEPDNH